jgi:hypothetical protein
MRRRHPVRRRVRAAPGREPPARLARDRPASEDVLKSWGSPELAVVYLVVCLALVLTGPGRLSIDARLGRK